MAIYLTTNIFVAFHNDTKQHISTTQTIYAKLCNPWESSPAHIIYII